MEVFGDGYWARMAVLTVVEKSSIIVVSMQSKKLNP
jgi:hypothetical protein